MEDVPPVAEAEPLARALLEQLPAMGGNALIAHRALRLMAAAGECSARSRAAVVINACWGALPVCWRCLSEAPPKGELPLLALPVRNLLHRLLPASAESGRIALRRAVVAVHAAATGADQPAGIPSAVTVAQAAQWVASR